MTFGTLSFFVTVLALGAALSSLLDCLPASRWARVAFAYLFGALASGIVAAAAVALRTNSFVPHVVVAGLATGAALSVRRRRVRAGGAPAAVAHDASSEPDEPASSPAAPAAARFLAGACVALLCLASATRATAWNVGPILDGDEAEIWAAKAHAFELVRGGSSVNDALADAGTAHPDYPPLNPLLQILVYDVSGGVAPYTGRWPAQWCGVLLIAATYGLASSFARGRAGPWIGLAAAVSVFACAWHEGMCRQGMSDGMVAFGLLFATDAAVRLLTDGDLRHGRRLGVALAFLAVSKNEGLMLAAGLLLGTLIGALRTRTSGAARRPREWWPWIVALGAPAAVWAWNAAYGLSNDVTSAGDGFGARLGAGFGSGRFGAVADFFWNRLVLVPRTGAYLVVGAAALAPLVLLGPGRSALGVAPFVCLAAVGGYGLVFTGTPNELTWHLETAAGRVLAHAVPTAAWALAAAASAGGRLKAPWPRSARTRSR